MCVCVQITLFIKNIRYEENYFYIIFSNKEKCIIFESQ